MNLSPPTISNVFLPDLIKSFFSLSKDFYLNLPKTFPFFDRRFFLRLFLRFFYSVMNESSPFNLNHLDPETQQMFEKLKNKYKLNPRRDYKFPENDFVNILETETTTTKPTDTTTKNAAIAGARLDNLTHCKSCKGSGFVKEKYNFMLIEKNCEICEGEGFIKKMK